MVCTAATKLKSAMQCFGKTEEVTLSCCIVLFINTMQKSQARDTRLGVNFEAIFFFAWWFLWKIKLQQWTYDSEYLVSLVTVSELHKFSNTPPKPDLWKLSYLTFSVDLRKIYESQMRNCYSLSKIIFFRRLFNFREKRCASQFSKKQ